MGTDIRNQISEDSKYFLPKHRYLELRHFCAQYYFWIAKKEVLTNQALETYTPTGYHNSSKYADKTAEIAIKIASLSNRINLIDRISCEADPVLGHYIFRAVTEELTYEALNRDLERHNEPPMNCGRNVFYSTYRKFFWLLDKERD